MTTFIGTISTDGYIRDDNTSYIGGTATPTYFAVGEDNSTVAIRRSLIKVDLSSIPTTSIITSATLDISVFSDASDNARNLYAYRVLRNWDNNYACWTNYANSTAWGTAGCSGIGNDREGTAIGTVAVAASPAVGSIISMPLSPTAVQGWVSGAVANYGVLLQVATESNDRITYNSSENGTGTLNPKWTINYTDSGGGSGYTLILNTT